MLPYSVVQHVKKKAKEPTDGIGDEVKFCQFFTCFSKKNVFKGEIGNV